MVFKSGMIQWPPPPSELVRRIALTGGPCGGKTTTMAKLEERLRNLGMQVFVVPEAASLITNAGAGLKSTCGGSAEAIKSWVINKLKMQQTIEDSLFRIAVASEKASVVICDTGLLDSVIHLPDRETWLEVLSKLDLTEQAIFSRYDFVLHLSTAAKGAEMFYYATHEAGCYTKMQAIEIDHTLRDAWGNHARFSSVENPQVEGSGIEEKTKHAVANVCRFLGVQSPTTYRQQYTVSLDLLGSDSIPDIDAFQIEITFLEGSTSLENTYLRRRISRKHVGETDSFTKCTKKITQITPLWAPMPVDEKVSPPKGLLLDLGSFPSEDCSSGGSTVVTPLNSPPQTRNTRLESTETLISQREYSNLSTQAMKNSHPLTIKRRCFPHDSFWFQLDYCKQAQVLLLEVETSTKTSEVNFPEWLLPHIQTKITGTNDETKYQPFRLAGGLDAEGD
eukprot:TRINITY_DN1211_c3_g1_i2.p1 TRINITY_DN1211_c3_g1~~TRINITY_DN1211_c3_g1_i2.p1  ORF type:complete len:449 (+),score=70.87 TRINITY_DN1211_c3_g1_i2:49-1395(+)